MTLGEVGKEEKRTLKATMSAASGIEWCGVACHLVPWIEEQGVGVEISAFLASTGV